MSYLEDFVKEIQEMIDSGVMFKFGNIEISPRKNDLPNHYIKKDGQNGTLDHDRINTVKNLQKTFDELANNPENSYIKAIVQDDSRVQILIIKKKIKLVVEKITKKNGTIEYVLVTCYKLRSYQIVKADSMMDVYEISSLEKLEDFLKNL